MVRATHFRFWKFLPFSPLILFLFLPVHSFSVGKLEDQQSGRGSLQVTDQVSSLVVFIEGKPAKSEYRKFILKTLEHGKPDDFAGMYEVVYRRYKRLKEEAKPLPDLIMVDGGKGQLSMAVKALQDLGLFPHPLIALAKRLEEVYIPSSQDPQNIPKTSSSNRLLQQIRDEAHRFAITFHREKRSKRTLHSELDEIEGIGEIWRTKLLTHFGSVKNIKIASLADLKSVPKIAQKQAEIIYQYFLAKDKKK